MNDLQIYLEHRNNERWELRAFPSAIQAYLDKPGVFEEKAIEVFLGSGKTFEGLEPIFAPRGFPNDCDSQIRDFYARSGCKPSKGVEPRSFVTLSELASFDWNKRNRPCALQGDYEAWKTHGGHVYGIPATKVWPPARPVIPEATYLNLRQTGQLPQVVFYVQVDRGTYAEALAAFLARLYLALHQLGKAEDLRLVYWFGPPPAPIKIKQNSSKKPKTAFRDVSPERVRAWMEKVTTELDEDEKDGVYPRASDPKRVAWCEQLMSGLKDCRWFKGYPNEVIPVIARQLRLRGDITTLRFDHELIEGGTDEEYKQILESFSLGSFGLFVPEKIKFGDSEDPDLRRCTFSLAGQTYEVDFDASSGWFDDRLFTVIKMAMAAVHQFLRFYKFPARDQMGEYAVVDPSAKDEAERRGLLKEL